MSDNLRQLMLDFIDTASDEEDEAAWREHLRAYDELLARTKSLNDTVRRMGTILDSHAICDECGEAWAYEKAHPHYGDCEVNRTVEASE